MGMPKHFYLLIAITFIVGVATGVYGFFLTRGETSPQAGVSVTEKDFEITAYTYGECERLGCSTYRVDEKGRYVYIPKTAGERFQDTLSEKQLKELVSELKETSLARVEESENTGTCTVYVDGLAYRYEIWLDGVLYRFDSCEQEIDTVELFNVLTQYFDIFALVHQSE